MDFQAAFNALFTVAGALAGFILKAIWDALKELQVTDTKLAEKVGHIEVLVVGSYAKREELMSLTKALFDKLDKIDNKLDAKVSVDHCASYHRGGQQ